LNYEVAFGLPSETSGTYLEGELFSTHIEIYEIACIGREAVHWQQAGKGYWDSLQAIDGVLGEQEVEGYVE